MAEYINKTELSYHERQLNNPYESTKALVSFIRDNINNTKELSVLDVPCGGGSNLIELAKSDLFKKYTGVDISEDAISIGKKYLENYNMSNINLLQGNFYRLEEALLSERFDVTLLIHTLFAVDEPFLLLEKMLNISKRYLLINSLFTTDKIFIKTIAHDLVSDEEHNWNIMPLCKLEDFLKNHKSEIIKIKDFLMPFDLQKNSQRLGSHTKQLIDGSRLTFTSQIYLPWKFILIEKKS